MDGGAIAHALLDALSSDGSIYIVNLPYVRPRGAKTMTRVLGTSL